jgi:hypothetical protein
MIRSGLATISKIEVDREVSMESWDVCDAPAKEAAYHFRIKTAET